MITANSNPDSQITLVNTTATTPSTSDEATATTATATTATATSAASTTATATTSSDETAHADTSKTVSTTTKTFFNAVHVLEIIVLYPEATPLFKTRKSLYKILRETVFDELQDRFNIAGCSIKSWTFGFFSPTHDKHKRFRLLRHVEDIFSRKYVNAPGFTFAHNFDKVLDKSIRFGDNNLLRFFMEISKGFVLRAVFDHPTRCINKVMEIGDVHKLRIVFNTLRPSCSPRPIAYTETETTIDELVVYRRYVTNAFTLLSAHYERNYDKDFTDDEYGLYRTLHHKMYGVIIDELAEGGKMGYFSMENMIYIIREHGKINLGEFYDQLETVVAVIVDLFITHPITLRFGVATAWKKIFGSEISKVVDNGGFDDLVYISEGVCETIGIMAERVKSLSACHEIGICVCR